jgi:chemotaxis protein methyltransferase CheR
MKLTIENFISFRNLIYERCGLYFESKKIYLFKKRLAIRMAAHDLEKVEDYLRLLKYRDPDGREFQQLLNILTTNETYMFREFDQLAVFAEHCLEEVCRKKTADNDKAIRIWCAGCSTGEEPYTLAIILLEMLEPFSVWKTQIIATDIDTTALTAAKEADYPQRSVKDVPDEYLQKYFIRKDGRFLVKTKVKDLVSFRHANLMDTKAIGQAGSFDFIFCRNVLIYFDDASRKEVVGHFYECLVDGGFIFLGHSESIGRISSSFLLRKMDGMIVYQKK